MKRALLFVLAAGCGGAHPASSAPDQQKVQIPIGVDRFGPKRPAAEARETPPASGATRESPFPAVARAKLANGMGVAIVPAHALPIVQIRVLVRAGTGYGAPAVAELTGAMLKDGGTRALSSAELLRRIETLGADLGIDTDPDGTTLSLGVPKEELGEALGLLAQIVQAPRFDENELRKTKARAVDEVEDAARGSGRFSAMRILFAALYPEKHPYALHVALPSELARVSGENIREFHRRWYVPKNAELVLVGDVEEAQGKALAEEHFGKWTGGDPPKLDFAAARAPAKTRVVVANRPKSAQSDVFLAYLGPERTAADWPALRVATHVLGGGVASRLFADVREQRSLAYRTSAQTVELAHGEEPLILYAGTETAKTTQAVTALLEDVGKMLTAPPTAAETETSRRYLADAFAIRLETIGAIANAIVGKDELGLPDGWYDAYRKELRATSAADAAAASKRLFAGKPLVVVAGDADAIAEPLARFGDVTVVDPEHELKETKRIPEKMP